VLLDPGRAIRSSATSHKAEPAEKGDGTRWLVTWMPGRILTWDQAVAAMTIAEEVALQFADVCATPSDEWWDRLTVLAAPLGLDGEEAVVRASGSPETALPWPPDGWDDPGS